MKIFFAVLVFLLVFLQYKLWFTEDGINNVWRLQKNVTTREAENKRLEERNTALAAEVGDLKDAYQAVEERARRNMGMAKRDEVLYKIVEHHDKK